MEDIHSKLLDLLDRDEPAALATVIATRGSVPREPGTQMLLCPGGQNLGTVGGGCGEGEVMRQALDVIATGRPRLVTVDLTEDISMQSQGICGGTMEVFVETWSRADRGLLAAFLAARNSRQPAGILTVVEASDPALVGRRLVLGSADVIGSLGLGAGEPALLDQARQTIAQGMPRALTAGGARVFVHVPERRPVALIAGAGHIAVPLAQVAAMCDFDVVVLDDRPSFANRERFPQASAILVGDYRDELRRFPIDGQTFIILITRGHQHDVPCLLEVLDRPAGYIGMIGSRRRVAGVFQLLVDEHGISRERLARVHSPIGLAIGAETPAEIAVSIMAEVIQVRRQGDKP
jgi:xanthine dehydrogenase accessory factor